MSCRFEVECVLSKFLGALLRAAIVVLVVAMPSLMLPGTTREGAELVILVAIVFAAFTAVEYSAHYPAMIEFRDAAPFNRLRLLSLVATLFVLSLVASGDEASQLWVLLNALGLVFAVPLDFPGSPLGAVIGSLHLHPSVMGVFQIKAMAGLAALIAICALAIFALLVRIQRWPDPSRAFNVWINLPTFDPTAGGDVVKRLIRDARVNAILGIVVAFILPMIGPMVAAHFDIRVIASAHSLVWGITLWMFLPLSLFMRALAMARIAAMIGNQRARLVAAISADGAQPA